MQVCKFQMYIHVESMRQPPKFWLRHFASFVKKIEPTQTENEENVLVGMSLEFLTSSTNWITLLVDTKTETGGSKYLTF